MIVAGLFMLSLILSIGANLISGDPMFGAPQANLANISHGLDAVTDSGQSGFIEQLGNIVTTAWRGVIFPFQFITEIGKALFWGSNELMSHPVFLVVKLFFWGMSVWTIWEIVSVIRGR
jgi:RsiW-degrading membrane proteinase PrsW (M82 family)